MKYEFLLKKYNTKRNTTFGFLKLIKLGIDRIFENKDKLYGITKCPKKKTNSIHK